MIAVCDEIIRGHDRQALKKSAEMVSVPREHLILWRRVMLQNPGDFEGKCAEEMSAALAAAKEGKK